MSDAGDSDFSIGDLTPIQAPDLPALPAIDPNDPTFQSPSLPAWGIQAPDISPNMGISPGDPGFQAPSIMGGIDFSGGGLPMREQTPSVPWTVQGGGLPQPAMPSFQGGSPQPPARSGGISKAFGIAGNMVDAAHGIIGQAGNFLNADKAIVKGIGTAGIAITTPLTISSGIANTVSQIRGGAPRDAAIIGNGARTGMVLGAGWAGRVAGGPFAPVTGPLAGYAADKLLPDGTTIGKAILQYKDTQPPDAWFD